MMTEQKQMMVQNSANTGIFSEKQQLVDKVLEQMEICSDMLGAPDDSKRHEYGFVPGINETETQKHLRDRMKDIEQGLYQVMFTGVFDSGKSTLLNALMHSDVLRTGILPETAVITKIVFGAPEEKVVIYKRELDDNGQHVTEVVPNIPAFFEKYRIDQDDKEKFLRLVDHAVLYQKRDGIAGSMVQLVDSPGTGASEADNAVSEAFMKQADAIVFLITATLPLEMADKAYIARHFAGKQMENLFFVVNKVNLLISDEEEEELKKYVRNELTEVFTDKNGEFNEALFQSRVFYVDAMGSMNTRMGRETRISRKHSAMIPDDETGVPEFERALGEFLTSGDRDKVTLSAYRRHLADFYVRAEQSKDRQLKMLEQGRDAVKKELDEYYKSKDSIEKELRQIEEDIDVTVDSLLADAGNEYDIFTEHVEADWDEYFSDKAGDMGVKTGKLITGKAKQMIQLWKDKGTRDREFERAAEEAAKPFYDGVRAFLDEKSEAFSAAVTVKLEEDFHDLEEKLDRHQISLESNAVFLDVDQLIRDIARECGVKVTENERNPRLGQALVALLLGDPELIEAAGGGNYGTIKFLVEAIKTNILDVIIVDILAAIFGVSNPIGLIVVLISFIIIKISKKEIKAEENTKHLLAETKNRILNGYDDDKRGHQEGLRAGGKRRYIDTFGQKVGGAMQRAKTTLTAEIRDRLDANERQLKDLLKKLEQDEHAYADEKKRTAEVLNTFAEAISTMSLMTDGTPLSVEEIRALASVGEEPA